MGIELDITGITNLSALLRRLPLGESARALSQRLGTWNTRQHEAAAARVKTYPRSFSDLGDDALSDQFAHWNAELVRISELNGLLEGQRKLLELQSKKARAQARSKVRREHEDLTAAAAEGVKVPRLTAGEINDRAEDDDEVVAADSALVMLDVVLESVRAAKEGCLTAVSGLSREISFRQAQFTARIRA